MREDFEEHLLPWARQFSDRLRLVDFTLNRFRVAASWVASRAFGVDGWHGVKHQRLADVGRCRR
jgi:SET domain-containing protein 6